MLLYFYDWKKLLPFGMTPIPCGLLCNWYYGITVFVHVSIIQDQESKQGVATFGVDVKSWIEYGGEEEPSEHSESLTYVYPGTKKIPLIFAH